MKASLKRQPVAMHDCSIALNAICPYRLSPLCELRVRANSLIPPLGISHKLWLQYVALQARLCRPLLSKHEAVRSCRDLDGDTMSLIRPWSCGLNRRQSPRPQAPDGHAKLQYLHKPAPVSPLCEQRSHSNSLTQPTGISHKLWLEHVALHARSCRPLLSEHEAVKTPLGFAG